MSAMLQVGGTMLCQWLLVMMSVGPLVKGNSCPSVCLCSNTGSNTDALQVDCQRKNLMSLPSNLSPTTEVLKLNGNDLATLPSKAFSTIGLKQLKNLRLRFNTIHTVHKDAFKNLEHLEILLLDYNQIDSLHADTFKDNPQLEIISLSNNPLTRLEDGLFTNKPKLSSVEVENCKLTYIGPKTFANVPNLYYLYLNGNKLTQVDFAALLPISSLRIILHKNPWKCDCQIKYLRDWMVKEVSDSNVELYKNQPPTCAEPLKLANKTWLETKSEEFLC